MKIADRNIPELSQTHNRELDSVGRRQSSEAAKESKPERDEAVLSQQAQEMQRIRQAIQEAPDVRQDKVEAIRKQVIDGTYQIREDELLDALLGKTR